MISAMRKTFQRLKDLAEEAKRRTFLWVIFVLGSAYLLSLTSSSIWMNIPVAASLFVLVRYLSFELEIRKRVQSMNIPLHLSHLLKHQMSTEDLMLISPSLSTNWRRKISSPVIEEAVDDFTRRIVQEFVTNLWYSALSPDKDVPEQIRLLVNDIFGELGQRVKRINLINLLTRDVVDLVGNHLKLFRQMRGSIKRFESLSSEDRENKLKQALVKGNQLHPALFSQDCECKVLQKLMGAMVGIILRPQDAQCLLMRGLTRELLACAVLRPVMNFASPGFINKAIEKAIASARAKTEAKNTASLGASISSDLNGNKSSGITNEPKHVSPVMEGSSRGKREVWGQVVDAVSDQRNRNLETENLDHLRVKGQNYRKRDSDKARRSPGVASFQINEVLSRSKEKQDTKPVVKDGVMKRGTSFKQNPAGDLLISTVNDSSTPVKDSRRPSELTKLEKRSEVFSSSHGYSSLQQGEGASTGEVTKGPPPTRSQGLLEPLERPVIDPTPSSNLRHRRTSSSNLGPGNLQKPELATSSQASTLDFWDSPGIQISLGGSNLDHVAGWLTESAGANEQYVTVDSATKLNCWVVGAHLEKAQSKTFAVYSIAVTDTDNKTWFVERRFRNFEQLHRKLRDLPQYNLQLPPKRFLASSLNDSFVRDRCILLDKYLKDLLSIPSIAELHEVWDFLSISSKSYAYAKSPSVMKTLAVNVDDAVDDMFRQLRGVSDGLLRRVGGPSSDTDEAPQFVGGDAPKQIVAPDTLFGSNILQIEKDKLDLYSDEEFVGPASFGEDSASFLDNWPFDNNDISNTTLGGLVPQRIPGHNKNALWFDKRIERRASDAFSVDESTTGSDVHEEDFVVPPEWTPPKLTEPLLNLVDSIFQLQDRGWIRRQCFWIAKQILQLGLGDAVDDWLVAQIQRFRQEDVVAGAIKTLKEVLWPGGVFITKARKADNNGISVAGTLQKVVRQASQKSTDQSPSASFESQLEAARCARVVYDALLEGAPVPLVSFVGKQQYVKCAKDIYYFLQSAVFLKQLVFSLLETLLVTVFPEMISFVLEIRHQGVG